MQRGHFEVVADVDQRHWWFLARRVILRRVLACVLPPNPDDLVIDVGCGTGANIAALADDYACIGIDTSEDAIAFAQRRFPAVKFLCGYAPAALGQAASQAKAMLLMDVLEHVENDRAVLEPLVRSMQPGALMLITVPADMRLWSAHDEGLLHFRRYDESMLQRAWKGLPVEPLATTHFCTRLYPLARLERSIGRMRDRLFAPPANRSWDMRVPTGVVNRALARAFEGEARILVDYVSGKRASGFGHGVSLMTILRRVEEASTPHRNGVR